MIYRQNTVPWLGTHLLLFDTEDEKEYVSPVRSELGGRDGCCSIRESFTTSTKIFDVPVLKTKKHKKFYNM